MQVVSHRSRRSGLSSQGLWLRRATSLPPQMRCGPAGAVILPWIFVGCNFDAKAWCAATGKRYNEYFSDVILLNRDLIFFSRRHPPVFAVGDAAKRAAYVHREKVAK